MLLQLDPVQVGSRLRRFLRASLMGSRGARHHPYGGGPITQCRSIGLKAVVLLQQAEIEESEGRGTVKLGRFDISTLEVPNSNGGQMRPRIACIRIILLWSRAAISWPCRFIPLHRDYYMCSFPSCRVQGFVSWPFWAIRKCFLK